MKWAKNEFGNLVMIIDDYPLYFHRKREKIKTMEWRCPRRPCKVRAITNDDKDEVRMSNEHEHEPTKYRIVNGVYRKLKKRDLEVTGVDEEDSS